MPRPTVGANSLALCRGSLLLRVLFTWLRCQKVDSGVPSNPRVTYIDGLQRGHRNFVIETYVFAYNGRATPSSVDAGPATQLDFLVDLVGPRHSSIHPPHPPRESQGKLALVSDSLGGDALGNDTSHDANASNRPHRRRVHLHCQTEDHDSANQALLSAFAHTFSPPASPSGSHLPHSLCTGMP